MKPDGLIIRLEVHHNIPHFRPGHRYCQPRAPGSEAVAPGLPGVPTIAVQSGGRTAAETHGGQMVAAVQELRNAEQWNLCQLVV